MGPIKSASVSQRPKRTQAPHTPLRSSLLSRAWRGPDLSASEGVHPLRG